MRGLALTLNVILTVYLSQHCESRRWVFPKCTCPTPPPPFNECPDRPIPDAPPDFMEIPHDCAHFIVFDNYSTGHYEPCPFSNPPLVFELCKGCIPESESSRTDCCTDADQCTDPTPPPPTDPPPTDPPPTDPPPTDPPPTDPPPTDPPPTDPPPTDPPPTDPPPTDPPPTDPPPTDPPPTDPPPTDPPPTDPPPTDPPPTDPPPTDPPPTDPPPTDPPPTDPPPTDPPPTDPPPTDPPPTDPPPTDPPPTSPCFNYIEGAEEVRIKNYPGCPNEPLDPSQFRIHLEIAQDCNHFIQCDNYGDGVCKVCAPAIGKPLVFDKSVNDQECVWPWESMRRDC